MILGGGAGQRLGGAANAGQADVRASPLSQDSSRMRGTLRPSAVPRDVINVMEEPRALAPPWLFIATFRRKFSEDTSLAGLALFR